MERFIGLDAHLSSCTACVVGPSGKQLRTEVLETEVLETEGGALVQFVRSVRGTRRLCMEEGTMSEWTCEVLSPHVDELVVLGIPPGKKGPKSDARDAFGLANQLRLGNTELAVYKGHGAFRRLCEQSRVYTGITDDVVRMKNRLKAMYRSRGIASVIVIVLVIVITGQLCPTPPTTASAGPG